MQIEPWREVLGPQQVLIVHFETYINDRGGTVASVSRFLGIELHCEQIRAETAYSKSEGRPVPKGPGGEPATPLAVPHHPAAYASLVGSGKASIRPDT